MNNKTKIEGMISTSAVCTYSYANAYAIQTIPLANDEDGVRSTAFIAKESTIQETAWPCDALFFDTAEQALAKLIALGLPRKKASDGITYPRVVKLKLKCDIKSVKDELSAALL